MKRISYICSLILFISHFTISAFSQQQQIQATIVDAKTGELLPGATIMVVGAPDNAATISDFDGTFSLKHTVKAGDKIRISFIGYKTLELPVESITAQTKIKLESESKQIQEVSVTGYAEGQTKALMDQKNALNIKNVVSQEQIEQFPDMNAAETLQRIPGITLQRDKGEGKFVQLRGTPPEYTNFNVNGEQIPSPEGGVRYVGLDAISSDQIEFIEVNKVLTPDMDADGIGGTVNIITKKAKSEKPEINASLSGGYSDLRQTPNYQGQLSFAQRSGKIGFSVNGNYYKNESGADNMEFKYIKGSFWDEESQEDGSDNYHIHYDEFQLRHYNITRTRTGLSSTLDYYFNNNHKVFIRGMYNNFTDHETRRRINYTLEDPVTETYYLYGGVERDLKDRTKKQTISSVNIGGENKIGRFQIDYEGSYSLATENVPDRLEITFDNYGHAIRMQIEDNDTDYPSITFPDSSNAKYVTDYASYELDELLRSSSIISDKNIGGKINFKIDYSGMGGCGYIKFGGKTRHKEKERDVTAEVYTAYDEDDVSGTGPSEILTEVTDGFSENNLLNHGYVVDWTPGPQETRDFFEYYQRHFYLKDSKTKDKTYGEDYLAHEEIYAAYGMISHNINNLMLLGGLRLEHTRIDYNGNKIIKTRRGNFESMEDTVDKRNHTFLLPQFQIKYSLDPTTNIRAAITRSFTRPNFDDVLPNMEKDKDEVKVGNPNLEFPQALNIDLMAEKYGKKGNMISAGLFYKDISNYIYDVRLRSKDDTNSTTADSRTIIPKNGKQAFVMGAEVLSQYKFSTLPSFLSNIGLYLNYTYTYSEAYINKRLAFNEDHEIIYILESGNLNDFDTLGTERISLPGQARHTLNLALFYETQNFYAKVSANYHDNYLHTLGAQSDLDEYYAASLHLDFNANYNITDNLKFFIDAKNLTNVPLKYYLGKPDNNRILKQEYYSWWFRMGLRLKLN